MYIAVRKRKQSSWALIQDRAPDPEADAPEVVPVGQMIELIPGLSVALEGFELPGSRVVDLVGVDARGDITLALCRLARTTEIRQECAARLLELAARLRREVPFREFESRVLCLKGRSLEDLVSEALPEEERGSFDRRAFRRRLAQNLEQGRVRLVLAVDEICDQLGSFIDFLADATEGLIRFVPVEMAVFECGAWEVMIPRHRPDASGCDEAELHDRDGGGDEAADAPDRPGPRDAWEFDEPDDTYAGDALHLEFADAGGYDDVAGGAEGAQEVESAFEDPDAVAALYEYLHEDVAFGEGDASVTEPSEAPEIVMSVAGRRHAESQFFERLRESCTRDGVRRMRRLMRLGREPGGTLPGGWIVSEDVLSFQFAYLGEAGDGLEPAVIELFRLGSDGTLVIDLPFLRYALSRQAVDGFVSDLEANPVLATNFVRQARCVVQLDQAFPTDHDARAFSVAVRRMIFGLAAREEPDGREAA
jgi:hypothetical protein